MKAISLWQPWASLWLSPAKRFETRGWPTNHRGWLLVHAAKRIELDLHEELADIVDDQFGCSWNYTLPRGAIIGMVNIVGCFATETPGIDADAAERECGDWRFGRFAWQRSNEFRVFEQPIPYRGKQGLFDVPDADLEQLSGVVTELFDPPRRRGS